ncbi:MAG TPA: hypothetical protein VNN74_08955 [Candidatus Micrarchaeia archaeon]|nr:hypothetical protein [Candidatus Micrarchaeia archaeon]
MQPADLARLPEPRVCPCGGPIRWSHIAYLGHGENVGVYTCHRCALAYRGPLRQRTDAGRGRRSAPDASQASAGPPDNPVIDRATAERLRGLLGEG